MARAERRAAQRAERERGEADKRRSEGQKQAVADRLNGLLEEAGGLRVEGRPNQHSGYASVAAAELYRAGESVPCVTFKQRYADKVTGYEGPRQVPVLKVTLHETPSERLLQFGVELTDLLREGERAVLNPGDGEVHTITTDNPDRIVGHLTAAGAIVTSPKARESGPATVEFTLVG